jgi:hypothetical protein
MLSDAFDSRLDGSCLAITLVAGGGIEMLARSTLPLVVSGSDDRAFLEDTGDDDAAEDASSWEAFHDLVLSALTVRESCSIWQVGGIGVGC